MTVRTSEAGVVTEPPVTPPLDAQAAAHMPPLGPMAEGEINTAPGLGETLTALREEVAGAVHERLHLVALEFKQVSLNATQMVLLGTMAGLMLAGAWASVLVAIYMACTTHGMPWGVALLLVLVLNVAGAIVAWLRAQALSEAFTFPASMRMIKRLTGPEPKVRT
ncbi:MAG: phage holin family protein [Aquabacterium sp.]